MKKRTPLLIVSIIMLIITIISVVCAITVTSSGFLDFSNWVRYFAVGIAVVCGISSIAAAVIAFKTK